MASNDSDIYDRLRALEQLVKHLYKQTGVPMPDLAALATTEVSDHVRQLVAAGNKMGAMKAYREETGVDLRTANQVIESLYGG
jgi:ribosomal protein L7/L12